MGLEELLEQQSAIAKQIKEAREAGRPAKIAQIIEDVKNYVISVGEIFPDVMAKPEKPAKKGGAKAEPKYRNPDNYDETWAGRGPRPEWLRNKLNNGGRLDDFLIK